jgi:hypothetical protein
VLSDNRTAPLRPDGSFSIGNVPASRPVQAWIACSFPSGMYGSQSDSVDAVPNGTTDLGLLPDLQPLPPLPVRLVVEPAQPEITVGDSVQFTVRSVRSTGEMIDVTDDVAVRTRAALLRDDGGGRLTALAGGVVVVGFSLGGQVASAVVTISCPTCSRTSAGWTRATRPTPAPIPTATASPRSRSTAWGPSTTWPTPTAMA